MSDLPGDAITEWLGEPPPITMPNPRRVYACAPPRMGFMVGEQEHVLECGGDLAYICVVYEHGLHPGTIGVARGTKTAAGFPPAVSNVEAIHTQLAHILIHSHATVVHDRDITNLQPRPLVPLEAGWTSPTVGQVPPGGVAPGDRPVHVDGERGKIPDGIPIAEVQQVGLSTAGVSLGQVGGWLARAFARIGRDR